MVTALFSPCLVSADDPSNYAGFGVDPLNPTGNPDPSQLAEMGVGLIRVVYRDSPTVDSYIRELIDNGIKPVLVLNWEANDQAWYSGDADAYSDVFKNY